jgi:hypothetical protein
MRVLLLDQLRPGDIILETGDPRIAAAAGMSFTHAAIALGRLVKIEAGKECGVVLNPFDFVSYRDGTRRFAGVPFDAGESVRVLRRKAPLDEGTMRGEAIGEAGRAYSVPKLLELPDLPESLRKRLQRKFERMPAPDTADVREGRFCSEVAAKILQLREAIVSPDGLASASELEAVGAAVAEIDPNRLEVGSATSQTAVGDLLENARVGLAASALSEAQGAVRRIQSAGSANALAEEAEALELAVDGAIRDTIVVLNEIEKLEPFVFAAQSIPIRGL